MKIPKIISTAIAILLVGCNSGKEIPASKELMVEAKVKVYHKDGSRSYKDYEPFATRTVELLPNFKATDKSEQLSIYGGDLNYRTDSTGFFYVKKIDNRWWGVDPLGYRYFNIALNSINNGKSNRTKKAFKDKFGTKEKWINETVKTLHHNGFNCAGSWSDTKTIIAYNKIAEKPLSYTVNWSFMAAYGKKRGGTYMQPGHTGYPQNAIFVFDTDFETFCNEHAKKLSELKDDPNLFGHFSDNEMPFKFEALDDYLSLPKDDQGYIAAKNWMTEQSITKDQITDDHRESFMAFVADKYFSIVSKAIKKYDPNHMYIGSRFYSSEKSHAKFMKTAGKYLDVVTCNYYNCWTPDSALISNWTKWSGKPFIVTEYYVKGEDSGMGNKSGAGWIVRTQTDRGLFYQNYNLALLESNNCVGWHYFKYQDNDPTAKGVDPSNLDANKGIVSYEYNLWTPMMEKMKELNTQVYPLIEYFNHK